MLVIFEWYGKAETRSKKLEYFFEVNKNQLVSFRYELGSAICPDNDVEMGED